MLRQTIFSICLCFILVSSFANTYYVSLTGDDATGDGTPTRPWRTLRTAVSKVSPSQGHTIKILAGTFVESAFINVPPGVNIEGSGIGVTILKPTSSMYFKSNAWVFDKFMLILSGGGSTNQSVKHLTIDGDSKQLYGGIVVKDRNNVLIENVRVQFTYFTGIWMWGTKDCRVTQSQLKDCAWGSTGGASGSIQASRSENLEIDHMDIDENYGQAMDAIASGPMYYLKVHDNRFSVNPAGNWQTPGGVTVPNIAVEFYNVELKGCQVYNNYFDNNFSIAMDEPQFATATGIQTIRVYNNTFDLVTRAKGSGHCIELTLHDAEVDHNYFYGGSTAIANWDASANPHTMHNWKIHHNSFFGISSYYPSAIINMYRHGVVNAHIYNNTVEMTGTSTVNFIEVNNNGIAKDVRIENNLIIDSNTSYQWYPNKFISLANGASMQNGTVKNNFLQKMAMGSVSGVSYGGNLSGDPSIKKTGSRPKPYYELNSGSPIIDKGVTTGSSFYGSAPDIGAHESGLTPDVIQPAPIVAITSPAANATFATGSTITVSASASISTGTIAKVEFFNGATKIGEDTGSPYSFAWMNVSSGTYNLTAKATSSGGSITFSNAINVVVSAGNLLPTINITSPSNNTTFSTGANIPIEVFATDKDGQIMKVEFFNGTVKLGEDTSSPHTFTWMNVPEGTHQLITKTTDNKGSVGTSAPISITVKVTDAQLPVVTVDKPIANTVYKAGGSIFISASATDSDGQISKVEFFRGVTKMGQDLTTPYTFNWTNIPAGNFDLIVKATDNTGKTSQKTIPVMITTSSGNYVPKVEINSPAANTTIDAGKSITIAAFATDKDGQIAKVEFFLGTTKIGEDTSSPHAFTWPNPKAGSYKLFAKAIDNQGAIGTSLPISITINSVMITAQSFSNSSEVLEVENSIPRVFTPNNDGISDYWEWVNDQEQVSIKIFDQSGKIVFESQSYENNWDGTQSGMPLPEDAYYYIAHRGKQRITGGVRIIR